MFIYNVTVNVDSSVHDEWLNWMKEAHVPDVMKTGCFIESKILKVLHVNDTGETYSFQYTFHHMRDIEKYQKEFAPKLQADVKERFDNKYTAFRTLLEIIE